MDSVRLGRVLGIGARLAGKTLAEAVDAATAPNPRGAAETGQRSEGLVTPPGREAGTRAGRRVRETQAGVQRGGRQFGGSVWRPFAKASGVLWLEVTGVFFGLIALFGAQGVWMYRGAAWGSAENHGAHQHFLLAVALAAVFGYFCVSSFVRAARKGRR